MQLSFYDASIKCYEQMLDSTAQILKKGQEHADSVGMPLTDIVEYRLHDTMLPFSFQVISIWHHSLGAINGRRDGVFTPPPSKPGIDYQGLCALVDEALAGIRAETPDSADLLSGREMIFRLSDMEIPFTTDHFLASFSLPNLYFHVTTTYSILRALGTPLGKRDFLGAMRIGH